MRKSENRRIKTLLLCFCAFQGSGAFPGHHREGGESPTGGGVQICGAAEETVRLSVFNPHVTQHGVCGYRVCTALALTQHLFL